MEGLNTKGYFGDDRAMRLIKVEPELFQEILLPTNFRGLTIEILAESNIVCGILDDENYQIFAEADSDTGIDKLAWAEDTSRHLFAFTPSTHSHHWLILWNAYSDKPIVVVYAIAPEGS